MFKSLNPINEATNIALLYKTSILTLLNKNNLLIANLCMLDFITKQNKELIH